MKTAGLICAGVLLGLLSTPAAAEYEWVVFSDTPSQDPLPNGEYLVDELGWMPPFPPAEWITSTYGFTDYRPCWQNPDDPGLLNVEVFITNMTTRSFAPLYYVADPETGLMNDDGLVNGELAFQIDAVGLNMPLVLETINFNGIFEPGETWMFVIQDYTNAFGLPASQFASIGVGNMSGGDQVSSGSIITPEPAALSLLLLALASARRRG